MDAHTGFTFLLDIPVLLPQSTHTLPLPPITPKLFFFFFAPHVTARCWEERRHYTVHELHELAVSKSTPCEAPVNQIELTDDVLLECFHQGHNTVYTVQ